MAGLENALLEKIVKNVFFHNFDTTVNSNIRYDELELIYGGMVFEELYKMVLNWVPFSFG